LEESKKENLQNINTWNSNDLSMHMQE
jgi:hypothetical protein